MSENNDSKLQQLLQEYFEAQNTDVRELTDEQKDFAKRIERFQRDVVGRVQPGGGYGGDAPDQEASPAPDVYPGVTYVAPVQTGVRGGIQIYPGNHTKKRATLGEVRTMADLSDEERLAFQRQQFRAQ